MVHTRHHKVPLKVNPHDSDAVEAGARAEEILDGMEKIEAVAALVESTIIWRAQYIAWNVDIFQAEALLFRLIFKEGSQNPQAMDLLARIYFQQGKYEKARSLWSQALELQPGNPALRRTAMEMRNIAASPRTALLKHRLGVSINCMLAAVMMFILLLAGSKGYDYLARWANGGSISIAESNLSARFSEQYMIDTDNDRFYRSITKDMVYAPPLETATVSMERIGIGTSPDAISRPDVSDVGEGAYNIGFTRKKVADGKELGRIAVVVERSGSTLKVSGKIPNLHVRYLVEEALWKIPGITDLDMRGLVVDRTYRVSRGDSLWIIARKIYGQGSSWTLLAKANDLSEPSKLKIGQELVLPLGDELLLEEEDRQ
jgi:LysM repeat protein